MPQLTIKEETAPGAAAEVMTAEFASERVTVEEVIRRHVALTMNSPKARLCWKLATQCSDSPPAEAALRAFSERKFVMFVGERQVEALEESVEITPATTVSFVRLMPLKGG